MEIEIDTVNLKSLNISGVLASYYLHRVHSLTDIDANGNGKVLILYLFTLIHCI